VRDNGYHLYIAAVAEYFDIFDALHRTEACFELIDIAGKLEDVNIVPGNSYINCGRNCADKECDKPSQVTVNDFDSLRDG
jgi:hypothetical protein